MNELKNYLRSAQASILAENVDEARINIELATEEYDNIQNRVSYLKKLPFIIRYKEYAIIFSSIAGAILTFFTLSELLKKKGSYVATTIRNRKDKKEEENS